MKLKIILSLILLALTVAPSYASFPVERTTRTEASTTLNDNNAETILISPAASLTGSKSMLVAILLWFFLGIFAAHRWYLGTPVGWNILFIVTLGGLGVWAIVDLVNIILRNFPGL